MKDKAIQKVTDLRTLPVVEVWWADACTNTRGWVTLEEARKDRLTECRTVGYLTKNTRKVVAVAQAVAEYGKVSDNWVIPRANIKKVVLLRKGGGQNAA